MSNEIITIRRAYVSECERFWRNAPVQLKHNKITNSKTLQTVYDAQCYVEGTARIWGLNRSVRKDRMYLDTLSLNCERAGAASSQYFTAQYKAGQQDGECKYILTVIYPHDNGRITVAYAYHDIEESLSGSNSFYTEHAEEITEDWLKSKSVDSIKQILSSDAWPRVQYI